MWNWLKAQWKKIFKKKPPPPPPPPPFAGAVKSIFKDQLKEARQKLKRLLEEAREMGDEVDPDLKKRIDALREEIQDLKDKLKGL